jgi:CoA:oxalate CoA-transferase
LRSIIGQQGSFELITTAVSEYQTTGVAPDRVGNRHSASTPFDTYQASDGLVVMAAANDRIFERLCVLIGAPDLRRDPRFATDELRTRHEPELRELV